MATLHFLRYPSNTTKNQHKKGNQEIKQEKLKGNKIAKPMGITEKKQRRVQQRQSTN